MFPFFPSTTVDGLTFTKSELINFLSRATLTGPLAVTNTRHFPTYNTQSSSPSSYFEFLADGTARSYSRDLSSDTVIVDPTDPAYRKMIPKPFDETEHSLCFVESSSGELLMVVMFSNYQDLPKMRPQRFEVFQLDNSEQQPTWFKITSIGDDVLFLNEENAMCFAASSFEGCRANCIYFWDNYYLNEFDVKDRVGLFIMGEDRFENLLLCSGSDSLFDFQKAVNVLYGWDEVLQRHCLDDTRRSRGVWIVPGL